MVYLPCGRDGLAGSRHGCVGKERMVTVGKQDDDNDGQQSRVRVVAAMMGCCCKGRMFLCLYLLLLVDRR